MICATEVSNYNPQACSASLQMLSAGFVKLLCEARGDLISAKHVCQEVLTPALIGFMPIILGADGHHCAHPMVTAILQQDATVKSRG